MASKTTNYGLNKHSPQDFYNVEARNENWDKIDEILGTHTSNKSNPHGVTAAQVGADAKGAADTALTNAKKYTDQKIAAIPTPDVSGQIETHNTAENAHADKFAKYLPLSGGTLTGTLTGKYISGTWLQATEDNHMKNTSAKVAVFDGNGWVYYRTVSELLADLNIPGSDAIRATTEAYGTTKLSNSVKSTSKTTAATPYAVKSALDAAKKYTDNSIKLAINSSY